MKDGYGLDDEIAAAAEAARAIEFIETHLTERLSVTQVANACGVSPFHFSRRFSIRQGESVMSYVRGRRLDKAAQQLLATPGRTLLEIAFNSGFESQSAFTRAFSRSFGVSPTKYRSEAQPRGRKRRLNKMLQPTLHQSIETIEAFRVSGLTGRFDPSTYLQIGELWKRSVAKLGFIGRLGDGETIGVFRDRNHAAYSFEHLAGARIAPDADVPQDFDTWTLSGQSYLVFKQMLEEGELHPQVAAAQNEIWNVRVPASGRTLSRTADFQIYPANFKVGPGGWLAYYIPIE